jgi:hypothetical protein
VVGSAAAAEVREGRGPRDAEEVGGARGGGGGAGGGGGEELHRCLRRGIAAAARPRRVVVVVVSSSGWSTAGLWTFVPGACGGWGRCEPDDGEPCLSSRCRWM